MDDIINNRLNILISGLGWSGSGAIVDLLKEYDNIGIVPGEFDDFRWPDLIGDLIENCETPEIKSVIKKSWRLLSTMQKLHFLRRYFFPQSVSSDIAEKIKMKNNAKDMFVRDRKERKIFKRAVRNILSTNNKEKRIEAAISWVQKIGDCYGSTSDYIVFDQPIRQEYHLKTWPSVFSPYKIIFVYREPKDQLANIMKYSPWYFSFNSKVHNNKTKNEIEFLCDVLLNRIKCIEEIYSTLGDNNVMLISFESLIQNYEESVMKVEQFLGLSHQHHTKKNAFLKPEESAKNIGIYEQFLNDEHYNYVKDLENWYMKKMCEIS